MDHAEFDDLPLSGLLDADAFNHPTDRIELLQTHISWIILTGRYAYKIKKPVNLGFLDFTTLEQRKFFCEEELRLNKRLSDDLYVDVVSIGGPVNELRMGALPAREYAVKMHQFGRQNRLDQLVAADAVTRKQVEALAHRIAHFHQSLPATDFDTDFGSVATVAEHIADNFAQLGQALGSAKAAQSHLMTLRSRVEDQLHQRMNAITERKQLGAVRECHGDLHTRNIARIADELTPFDCLEFNPSMRCIDVISEAAFLMMDLLALGRQDLAYAFINAYLEETGDYAGIEVLRMYLAYRGMVRAKVAAIAAENDAETARYIELSRDLLQKNATPWIIVMHGFSGSGKSWLADRISAAFPAIRIRSDVERKRLHGLAASASSDSGIASGLYSTASTRDTYRRLAGIAQHSLRDRFNVIVDAACLQQEQRMIFRDIARNSGARFVIVNCTADRNTLEQRVAMRAQAGTSFSEAGLDVLAHQRSSSDPLTTSECHATVNIATDKRIETEEIIRRIQRTKTS